MTFEYKNAILKGKNTGIKVTVSDKIHIIEYIRKANRIRPML